MQHQENTTACFTDHATTQQVHPREGKKGRIMQPANCHRTCTPYGGHALTCNCAYAAAVSCHHNLTHACQCSCVRLRPSLLSHHPVASGAARCYLGCQWLYLCNYLGACQATQWGCLRSNEVVSAYILLLSATMFVPVASTSPLCTSVPRASVSLSIDACLLLLNLLKKPPFSEVSFGGRFLAGKMKDRIRQMMLKTAPTPLRRENGRQATGQCGCQ